MKQLREYLAESTRTYDYRIKVCGDVPPGFFAELKDKLAQFDVEKMSDTKTTPVLPLPTDFPNYKNERVSFVDVSFRYPAIEPQIKQIAQLLQLDPNRIVMHTESYTDSMGQEYEQIDAENKGLLTDTDFPAPNKEQKALSKDYSADAHDHAVLKNSYRSQFAVAGGKTSPAETTNDLPQGKSSPVSGKNKLPAVKSFAR
jgi:hypothetical protein